MITLSPLEQQAVDTFWQLSSTKPTYPCNIEQLVALALPLTIVKLPKLKLHKIEGWLQKRQAPLSLGERSRAVRGCLVAQGGEGIIFIDGTDHHDEQRFTLAHEVAHFMLNYQIPRQQAINRLGTKIEAVLDGLRPPTIKEQLQSILNKTSLGLYINLLSRQTNDNSMSLETLDIENQADRVALALLAPPASVLRQANLLSSTDYTERKNALINALCQNFGLPVIVAEPYAIILLNKAKKGRDSWLTALRKASLG